MRTSNPIKKIVLCAAAIGCIAVTGGLFHNASAVVCEYPLFITEGSVEANVLFIFDNSGSMNEVIWHEDYDPNVIYSGGFHSDMYYISSSGWYSYNGVSAYLVRSDLGEDGRYAGNYMNWVYYNATAEQRAAIPRVTRIQVSKACVVDIIQDNPGIRFGVMVFNTSSEGGTVVSPLGTDEATLISQINGVRANCWTPLGETMVNAAQYYARSDASAPIQYKCQKNFLVIVSDGFPTMDRNSSVVAIGDRDGDGREPGNCASIGAPYDESNNCSDYMDDVATYLYESDLRDLEGQQNVITYAIGFNIDAQLFRETADNGHGIYLTANNPEELLSSLNSVLTDIVNRISSGSAVAVVSTEGESEDLLFRGKFVPATWRGYVEAFVLPYEAGESPPPKYLHLDHFDGKRAKSSRPVIPRRGRFTPPSTACSTSSTTATPTCSPPIWEPPAPRKRQTSSTGRGARKSPVTAAGTAGCSATSSIRPRWSWAPLRRSTCTGTTCSSEPTTSPEAG